MQKKTQAVYIQTVDFVLFIFYLITSKWYARMRYEENLEQHFGMNQNLSKFIVNNILFSFLPMLCIEVLMLSMIG